MLLTILAWVIIGAIAGWLASKVTGTDAQVNGFGNVVAGIIGALVGGWLLTMLGVTNGYGDFSLTSLLTAFVGAVIVLFAYKAATTRRF